MGLGQFGQELQQPRHDAVRLNRLAEDIADLTQQDTDRNTVKEADKNRLGEEVCECAEAQETCANTEQPGKEHQGYLQGPVQFLTCRLPVAPPMPRTLRRWPRRDLPSVAARYRIARRPPVEGCRNTGSPPG